MKRKLLLLISLFCIYIMCIPTKINAEESTKIVFNGKIVANHYFGSFTYDNPSNYPTTSDFTIDGYVFYNGERVSLSDVTLYVPSDELIIYGKQSVRVILKVNGHNDYITSNVVIYVGKTYFNKSSSIKVESTKSTIKLSNSEYYEYSIDGIKWQNNNKFTHLNSNKKYTVYWRLKTLESDNTNEIYSKSVKTK